MSKLHLLFIAVLIFFAPGLSAQPTDPSLMKQREYAAYCIKNLKDGTLVVRLNFKTKAIIALLQAGNTNGANDIRYKQEEENITIMKAFKKHFKFCPVYFVSFDSTIALVNGRQAGVFLNDDLKPDPSIQLRSAFFLFAEYGMIETAVAPDKLNPEQETSQRGIMEDALIIRDKDLKLLKDPFPYYVHLGNWDARAKKLNKKFEKYYQLALP
jgi:hypothetical protein